MMTNTHGLGRNMSPDFGWMFPLDPLSVELLNMLDP